MTEKKTLFLVIHCQKNVLDEKGCLKNLFRKSHSPKTSRIKRWMMEVCFAKISRYKMFLIQKNSANKICEV